MQIPTNFSAAQAASIASVVSSRDKASAAAQTAAAPTAQALIAQLEKSESSNPDRDAQGQGDGFGEHARKAKDDKDENEVANGSLAQEQAAAPEDDRPDLLDLVC